MGIEILVFAALSLIAAIGGWLVWKRKDHTSLPGATQPQPRLPEPETVSPQPPPPVKQQRSWADRLQAGVQKTKTQLWQGLKDLPMRSDQKNRREEVLEKLFESFIAADVGVRTTQFLLQELKSQAEASEWDHVEKIQKRLKIIISNLFANANQHLGSVMESPRERPHVVLMVGVNGVGKTTTTGKLAFKSRARGQNVVVGAADTFRAAAVDQLAVWAERSGAAFVRLQEGKDPAAVAFETVKVAREQQADIALIDTAGRLHNRKDLMDELAKIRRVVAKDVPSAPHEVLLVLDATTGQNGIQQAKVFQELVSVTGLILTKLDGTAKGGVALAIAHELGLPIRYVGVGESVEDLDVFQPNEFCEALF